MSRAPLAAARWLLPAVAAAFAIDQICGLDYALADWLYRTEGSRWSLRHAPLFSGVLHAKVQTLSYASYAVIVVSAIACRLFPRCGRVRQDLAYVAVSYTICVSIVAIMKKMLPIPCPWDLQRYGGALAAGGWLDWQPGVQVKGCFPSGHATGGYTMCAWYFLARARGWRHAPALLAIAGAAGLTLGIVQQLRGAHFLSHDITCAALCWAVADGLAAQMLTPAGRTAAPVRGEIA